MSLEANLTAMEETVRILLERVIGDLVTLETVFFFYQNPDLIENSEGVASRLQRGKREVAVALERLAGSGLLERFELGQGRHVIYSFTEDRKLKLAVSQLSTYYHEEPALRAEIIGHVLRGARG